MKTTAIDSDESVLQRIFGAAILGVPLAFILGWQMIAFALPMLIFPWAFDKAGRVVDLARTPFSFCLPGFRESLCRRCFVAGTLAGVAISLLPAMVDLSMWFQGLSHSQGPVKMCLSMTAAFGVGMVIALSLAAARFILSRRERNLLLLLSIPLFLGAVVMVPAFIEYAFVGIPFCAAACLFVWFRGWSAGDCSGSVGRGWPA